MKYIGIDYGAKRVGVAVSDETGAIAFPKTILRNGKTLLEELAVLAKAEGADAVVMGNSIDSLGRENAIMEEARRFAEILGEATGLPIHFERESFSSVEARRMPTRQNSRSGGQMRTEVDDSAAALILQRYLDKNRLKGSS